MPVTFGGTNTPGDSARLLPWHAVHYIVRGGANDPVLQTNQPPTSGGSLSVNSVITLAPIPGTQTPPALPLPRVQSLGINSALSGTVTSGGGGIFIGTIPQGAWIESVEVNVYSTFTGGTPTGLGVFYAVADSAGAGPSFVPTTLFALAAGSAVSAALYSTEGAGFGRTAFSGPVGQVGPGSGTAGATQLASLSDIDLYAAVLSNTTVLTAGSMSVRVKFTGLEG